MKKQLLLLSGIVFSSISIAQPTLNATDLTPSIGQSFSTYQSAFVSAGSAGANQTWDFSSLTPGSTTTISFSAPSASYPGTSMQQTFTNGAQSSTMHLVNSGTKIDVKAIVTSAATINYSNNQTARNFPMTNGSTFNDNFVATFNSSGTDFIRSGTSTYTVDGYGTLITPEGTFTNCIRVHLSQNYQDSSIFGLIDYSLEGYYWYKAGIQHEILTINSLDYGLGVQEYSEYLESTGLGLTEEESIFALYPNPAIDLLTIETKNSVVENYSIIDIKGQVIQSGTISEANNTINISSLAQGNYTIIVNSNSRKRFVKL